MQCITALAAILAALVPPAASLIPGPGYSFEDFNADFSRGYVPGSAEYLKRQAIFEEQLKRVLLHNADSSKTWKRGINQYADLTRDEFKASGRLGYNRRLARHMAATTGTVRAEKPSPSALKELPKSVDWRTKGVVSDVKDQGHCGSCWAFATTETVESHVALATGMLPVLSPQQLVSCAPNPLQCGGVGGCEGSIPEVAYNYIQLYGMTTEWMLPYTSYFGAKKECTWNHTSTQSVITISGYIKLTENDYDAVMHALATQGPLAVNVQADAWHDYESGVFDGCSNMSNVAIDHVVQLVGYGTDTAGGDYWLVRNSWDATWGEAGYIRLKRTSTPQCGTDAQPLDGTGCANGPPTQHVCGECGVLFDVSYPLGASIPKKGHHTIVV